MAVKRPDWTADALALLPQIREAVRQKWPYLQDADLDDMQQVACIAAVLAAPRFNPRYGGTLLAFLRRRALGECVDELRRRDGRPRQRIRPRLAADLPWDKNEDLPGFDAFCIAPMHVDYRSKLKAARVLARHWLIQQGLYARIVDAALLYFIDGLRMREVGEMLGVSESRIAQMFRQMLDWDAVVGTIEMAAREACA